MARRKLVETLAALATPQLVQQCSQYVLDQGPAPRPALCSDDGDGVLSLSINTEQKRLSVEKANA